MKQTKATLIFICWLVTFGAIAALLMWLGQGSLATPALNASAIRNWAVSSDPVIVVFTAMRLLALVVALYLCVATLLLAIASALRVTSLSTIATVVAGPVGRRIVRSAVGISIVGAMSVPLAANASTPVLKNDTPILRHLTADEANPTFSTTTTMTTVERPAAQAPPAPEPTIDVHSNPQNHVVASGESLWSISKDELATALGRTPTDQEVHDYWLKMIADNRSNLARPNQPGLIYPGQKVDLPELA